MHASHCALVLNDHKDKAASIQRSYWMTAWTEPQCGMQLKGWQVETGSGITTRSRAKQQQERWVMLPAPVKLFSLLVDTVGEQQEGTGPGLADTAAAAEDEWEDASDDGTHSNLGSVGPGDSSDLLLPSHPQRAKPFSLCLWLKTIACDSLSLPNRASLRQAARLRSTGITLHFRLIAASGNAFTGSAFICQACIDRGRAWSCSPERSKLYGPDQSSIHPSIHGAKAVLENQSFS